MNDILKKDISELLLKYFGHSTAEAFAYYYNGKSDDAIFHSLEKILTEYMGAEKTREEINKLKKNL